MAEQAKEKKGIAISRNPVMYVYFEDSRRFDEALAALEFCAEGERQAVLSAGYLKEQIGIMAELGEETPEEIQEVVKAIDTDGFDGDVWFYADSL